MDHKNFKTEQEKKYQDQLRKIVLSHCVACHQQLDLLQLRLINFDDLIIGVQDTITLTTKQLTELKQDKPSPTLAFEPAGKPTKLKTV
jgi:mono/diheme cytochrome c family protein